ncbi:MAG: hypothetical protein ACLUEQ_02095 [Cloacibacillus evryensis]
MTIKPVGDYFSTGTIFVYSGTARRLKTRPRAGAGSQSKSSSGCAGHSALRCSRWPRCICAGRDNGTLQAAAPAARDMISKPFSARGRRARKAGGGVNFLLPRFVYNAPNINTRLNTPSVVRKAADATFPEGTA